MNFKIPNIPLAKQAHYLRLIYPESKCFTRFNKLTWFGKIKPSPISRIYKIKISCDGFKRPKVILYGDNLRGIEKADFPHKFNVNLEKSEVELCLHMFHEFSHKKHLIADTIVLWTQEWLFFYEIWLETGEWLGGGHNLKN
ncbi:MAG: hypothetical protein KIG68_00015 [Oxalobacter sp.]|nr:hypothetical protein [Oxalobacter sp.]